MGTVYAALSIAMSVLGALLLPVRGTGDAYRQVRSLLKVSASRARVLGPTCCHSENDDGYHFCQWCGNTVSAHYRQVDGKGPLKIDEDAISRRYRQFTAAWAEKASKSRSSTWNLFSRFVESRSNPGATCIEATQPKDVVEYLC